MIDIADPFISKSRSYLNQYLSKVESCLEILSDEDIWWRANENSLSIGNLMLHLEGSTRTWIISVAGGFQTSRDRQQEFDEREHIPRAKLLNQLQQTMAESDEVLARIDAVTLLERRRSPWKEVTVFDAIYHAVEHFSMHTGQIIMLTKMKTGRDLKLTD